MANLLTRLGTARPPFVAALAVTIIASGGILADRFGLMTLPQPSADLVASVMPGSVVALTNEERQQSNLGSLKANALLTRAAQMKADDMAAGSYYAHVSPDGTIPPDWLKRVGYKYQMMGENLVIDRENSDDVVSAWMGSTVHRENILNPQFTEIGIGVAHGSYKGRDTIYVVQMLARPQIPTAAPAPAPKPVQQPVTVSIPVPKPTIVAPTPVKTAATTSVIVRPPAPKPVVRDTIKPILESITATNTLQTFPSLVASSTYLPPALGVSTSTVVELAPAATQTPETAPRIKLSTRLQTFALTIGGAFKDLFTF